MIKYNYPHFTDEEIEAQIICPVGNTQSQELNTGFLAPRSTVFIHQDVIPPPLWNSKGQLWFCEWKHMCAGRYACVCVSGRSISLEKNTLPKQTKNLFHKVVGRRNRNKHQASAGCRKARAVRAPSGFLFYFTKFPACPLGPFTESK